MSGFRGVAEAYEAQWTAHLNSAVANAFRQTLAEKPPDPVARIGRLLTARVDGPAPQFVPPPASPWDPLSQAQSEPAYNSRWSAHINAMFTQAWKQTFTARPADPVVHLGRLMFAASTAGAVTALEAENASLRAQLERERAMRAIDQSLASGATSQQMAPAAPAPAHPPPAEAAVRKLKVEHPPLQSTEPLLSAPETGAPGNRRKLSLPEEEGAEEDQGEWSLLAWARGAGVHRVVAAAIQRGAADKAGEESVTDSDAIRDFLRGLTGKSELAPLFGTGPVADAMTDLVWVEVEKLKLKLKGALTRAMMGSDARNEASTDVMGKFDGAIELSFFGLDKFFGGLGGIIGEPSPKVRDGMEAEHLGRSESTETFVTGCAVATASAHSSSAHQHICTLRPNVAATMASRPPPRSSGSSWSAQTKTKPWRESSCGSSAGPRSLMKRCQTAQSAG